MPQPQEIIPSGMQACVALYDNSAETSDELSFKSGDILTVVQQDSPELEGWWICSLRGKQGICPSNRLRPLTEAELNFLREKRRRSWNTQSNKAVGGPKYGDVSLYDMPQVHFTDTPQMQYDVPLSTQALPSAEESYDVPKPVGGSLTPSSSISSLTTDSNRSSLIQQDYDVPRPTRLQPTQEEDTGSVWYDVPRSGGEVPLDLDSALDWLGRLETQTTSATSRLLACAGPHWRTPQRLQPRLAEVRAAVSSLTTSLHQLTLFIQPILISLQEKALGRKLSVLFEALVKADVQVRESASAVDSLGWTVATLGVEDEETHDPDHLDQLVSAAAILTDDIRQITSFIQGNSTLLFKKSTPMSGNGSEELTYMNVEKKDADSSEDKSSSPLPPVVTVHTTPQDRKILEFYTGQFWMISGYLSSAIDTLLLTVTQNQPPKAFLSQSKAVIAWAHKLVGIGDAVERNLSEGRLRKEIYDATNSIGDATSNVVHKTKSAALHFPSVTAVQYMVDSIVDLSHKSKALKQALLAH